MNSYLLAIGWWNFAGSCLMMGMLNENFGKKMLNEWTKVFKDEFKLDYWGKLWLFWAAGLNIFFGLINIMAAGWDFADLKKFLIISDIVAYIIFFWLAIWGQRSQRCDTGIYTAYVIFAIWIFWGFKAVL